MGMAIGIPGLLLMLAGIICVIVFGIILIINVSKKKPAKTMTIATSVSGGVFILGIILFSVGIATTPSDDNSSVTADTQETTSSGSSSSDASSSEDSIKTNMKVPEEVKKFSSNLDGVEGWKKPEDLAVTKEKYSDGYKYAVDLMSEGNIANIILSKDGKSAKEYVYMGKNTQPALDMLTSLDLFNDDINSQLSEVDKTSHKTYTVKNYNVDLEMNPDLGDMAVNLKITKSSEKEQAPTVKSTPKKLSAGKYTVGKDVDAGRYKVTPVGEGSNFVVYGGGDETDVTVNTILGQDGEPSYTFDCSNGDVIQTESTVKLTPVN